MKLRHYDAIQICLLLLLLLLLLFYPGRLLNSQVMKRIAICKKVQKSSWNEPYSSSSFTKQSCSKMTLYRWIRTQSRWNKKLISLSSPDWSASLRPSLERKTRPDALIGPSDSTATGWKMWWAWMFEYFASSAADPASRAAAATYESANGQITVTPQVSGFPLLLVFFTLVGAYSIPRWWKDTLCNTKKVQKSSWNEP